MKWKLGQDSSYKLIAWFNDGNTVTRYSLDWVHQYSKNKDPNLGLVRLRKLLSEYGSNAEVVCIYINKYGTKQGQEIEKYYQGIKQLTTTI